MVTPRVDFHIGCRRHVTFNTRCTATPGLVEMVLRCVVLVRLVLIQVTGCAQTIIFEFYLGAVGIVAIGATNPFVIHFALNE